MIRKDFDNNSYLVNNNALYRKHTEHISTTEPLYLDGMSGSDNIVHEPEDPMIVRYVTTEDNQTITLWGNPGCIKSIIVDGSDADIKNPDGSTKGNYQYTFAEAGEHIVEIKLNGNSIPGGTFGANVAVAVIPNGVTNIMPGAFYGNTTLKEVVIPRSVTEIGTNNGSAFGGCTNLESITIQNATVDLPTSCFAGLTNLKYVDLGDSIATIYFSAFGGCSSLESLTIPKSATIIGSPCGGCTNLKTLIIHGKIATGGVASGLPSLETVILGDGVTTITGGAFARCQNLKSVTIGKNVTEIQSAAIGGGTNLTELIYTSTIENFKKINLISGWDNGGIGTDVVHCTDGDYTIPFFIKYTLFDNLVTVNHSGGGSYHTSAKESFSQNILDVEFGELCTGIDDRAFYSQNYPNIRSVKLSNTITSIGSMLSGNQHVKSIIIPESVTYAGTGNQFASTKIEEIIINSNEFAKSWRVFGNYGSQYLNTVIFGKGVTTIGEALLVNNQYLSSVTILGNVTTIGSSAFSGCSNLQHIDMPQTVTSIGSSAFSGCQRLEDIKFPNSLTSIGNYAFQDCKSFNSITIPESVTSFGISPFSSCSGIKEIYYYATGTFYPSNFNGCNNVKTIVIGGKTAWVNGYMNAFQNLKSLTIGELIDNIPSSFCTSCQNLQSVTILSQPEYIRSGTFYGCSDLTTINIPDTVTTIESQAFECCTSLTKINIPDSVISIGSSAFEGCGNLINIIIPESVESIGSVAFQGCSGLNSVIILGSILDTNSATFQSCVNLKEIKLPKTLEIINSNAFSGCSNLKEIVIPESITEIRQSAFYGCNNLTSVTILKTTPPDIDGAAFGVTFTNLKIYVPAESVEDYKTKLISEGSTGVASKIYPIPEE